jgi:hypothetical protein
MPRLRPRSFLSTLLLVAALVLFSASTLLAQPMTNPSADSAKAAKTMTWVLTQGTVINPEQIKTEGKVTTGYMVEATATAQGPARVNTGKFTIRCTIVDMGDHFQLRGAWDITRTGALKATHHTPDSIKGNLMANLDFNPAASLNQAGGARTINAKAFVGPKRRFAGQEAKAGGTFTGDDKFNGTISITKK